MEIYMDSEVDINLNQDIDLFSFQYSLLVRLYQALLPVQGHLAALHVHHLRHHHHHLHLRLRRWQCQQYLQVTDTRKYQMLNSKNCQSISLEWHSSHMHCIIKLIFSSPDIMSHSFFLSRWTSFSYWTFFYISCISDPIRTIIVYFHTFVTFSIFISLPSHILSFSIFNFTLFTVFSTWPCSVFSSWTCSIFSTWLCSVFSTWPC